MNSDGVWGPGTQFGPPADNRIRDIIAHAKTLEDLVVKYREALEFYATPMGPFFATNSGFTAYMQKRLEDLWDDLGQTAREALKDG